MKTIFLMVLTLVLMSCNQSRTGPSTTGPSTNGDLSSDFIEVTGVEVTDDINSVWKIDTNGDGDEDIQSTHVVSINIKREVKEISIVDNTGAFTFNAYKYSDRINPPPPNTIEIDDDDFLYLSSDSTPDISLRTITIDMITIIFVDENGAEIIKVFDNINQTFSIVVDSS